MNDEIVNAFAKHRITFMGSPRDTRFGFGAARGPITLEPFIQFRGGVVDARRIGAFTYLGCRLSVFRHIESIGRFCSIATNITTGPAEHATSMLGTHSMFNGQWDKQWPELFDEFGIEPWQISAGRSAANTELQSRSGRIKIGNDVWIGEGVFISRGVSIGDGAIIAARSVVTKDVEPYAIVGGIPARTIRYRFAEELRLRLAALQWWDYGPSILKKLDWSKPEECLSVLEARVEGGAIKYSPKTISIRSDGALDTLPQEVVE